MMLIYWKPNGEYTEDVKEAADAWMKLAAPIEKATGWKLYAFSPDLAFRSPNGHCAAQLPVGFARALSSALKKEE